MVNVLFDRSFELAEYHPPGPVSENNNRICSARCHITLSETFAERMLRPISFEESKSTTPQMLLRDLSLNIGTTSTKLKLRETSPYTPSSCSENSCTSVNVDPASL